MAVLDIAALRAVMSRPASSKHWRPQTTATASVEPPKSSLVAVNLPSQRVFQQPAALECSRAGSSGLLPRTPARPQPGSKGKRGCPHVVNYAEAPDSLPYLWKGDDGEGDLEGGISIPTVARLERSFEAQAVVGRVECNSKGCRPVFDQPPSATSPASSTPGFDSDRCIGCASASSRQCTCERSRQAAYAAAEGMPLVHQSSGPMACLSTVPTAEECGSRTTTPSFPMEFAEFVDGVWSESRTADKYYRTAVLRRPFDVEALVQYAEFSWQKLRNRGQAESLFGQALEEEPENAAALASYALFLWESESASAQ